MSTTAYIFPGQGSQYVGMGKDLHDRFESAQKIYSAADDILGASLSGISFDGPLEELKQTRFTQPAIFVQSYVLLKLLQEELGVEPKIAATAGHSLGEYSALVAASVLDFEDALRVVKVRAEAMQKAGEAKPGTMAAIIGLDDTVLEGICQQVNAEAVVQCANYNSPGQVVISGSVQGVHEVMELALAQGARMAKELVVSGAFHSELMSSAREAVKDQLAGISLRDAKVPVYCNVTAEATSNANEIKKQLVDQITSPVRWHKSVQNMIAAGVSDFKEIGPGAVLQGLVKRTDRSVSLSGLDKLSDLLSSKSG